MKQLRKINTVKNSQPTLEGAGVRLRRAFAHNEAKLLDPFLLLDDFRGDNPESYIAGFPWHPHRGIETVTYMIEGKVKHEDSLGNGGIIGLGDVQWMTAGSGIIHSEMPQPSSTGRMGGFQLWVNLPAKSKMMAPRYQEIKEEEIPKLHFPNNIEIKLIAGNLNGTKGPVKDIVVEPTYLDVTIPPEISFTLDTNKGFTCLAYAIDGEGYFDEQSVKQIKDTQLVTFDDGEYIYAKAGKNGFRFLFISGMPLKEPIAWAGPIVMNSQAELQLAFEEYRQGTFLKHK